MANIIQIFQNLSIQLETLLKMEFSLLDTELTFKTSRSGGSGGQHVNKTETKVTLEFHVQNSQFLSNDNKSRILERLQNRINQEGVLQISSSKTRSQLKNKEIAIQLFHELIERALQRQKKRKVTKPTKSAIAKRLNAKKQNAEKKNRRNNKDLF